MERAKELSARRPSLIWGAIKYFHFHFLKALSFTSKRCRFFPTGKANNSLSKTMTKSYAESSSQTAKVDPGNCLKNYCNIKPASNRENVADNQSANDASLDEEEELQRRLDPTTPKDFETLQTELLQWRRREERKITITARNKEHKQDMKKLLLKKEEHLLRKIGQLKISATDKWKKEKLDHMMDMMAQPLQWEVSDGSIIGVDTPATSRAREMTAMYKELSESCSSVATRVESLERIKAFVETFDHCGLVKDICSLIDRELHMLNQCTDLGPELLVGMRKRLLNQFTKLVTKVNGSANYMPHSPTAKTKFQLEKADGME